MIRLGWFEALWKGYGGVYSLVRKVRLKRVKLLFRVIYYRLQWSSSGKFISINIYVYACIQLYVVYSEEIQLEEDRKDYLPQLTLFSYMKTK